MRPTTFLPLSNPYALLATFLSPCPNGAAFEELREAARKGILDWNPLLFQANMHFCTPLWYVRLRQNGLLAELPQELQEYLHQLHQANVERTNAFRKALRDLLMALEEMEIPAILLKGAATFCDDLYEDPGARMMGDIDFLVETKDAERVRDILFQSGFVPLPRNANEDFPPEYQPQHLPRMLMPASPAALEIHVRVERGQAGRVLPTALAWECRRETKFEGLKTLVLNPSLRLLHNTVHALVPQREFIQSNISLLQLAEFAALAHRYGPQLDWREWYERGAGQNLKKEFATYLTLGSRLMGVPWPEGVPKSTLAEIHAGRILLAGKYAGRLETSPERAGGRFQRRLVVLAIRIFYELNRFPWVWRNVCYVEGSIWASTRFLLRKISESVRYRPSDRVA